MTLGGHIKFKQFTGWALTAFVWVALVCAPLFAMAQTNDLTPPDFTEKTLSERITAIQSNEDLSEDQKTQVKAFLETAIARLADASRLKDVSTQYQATLDNNGVTLKTLTADIEEARQELSEPLAPPEEMIGEAALYTLEQQLLQKESRLRSLQADREGISSSLQSLTTRTSAAPNELNEARTKLTEITAALSELGETDLDSVNGARRTALLSRQYFRRMQIFALEREIASLPQRQEILLSRRILTDLNYEILLREVEAHQEQTGQRRVNEANEIQSVAQAKLEAVSQNHIAVVAQAQDNLDIAKQIKSIALKESKLSKDTAVVRGQRAYLIDDVAAAKKIVSLGQLDREAGATLRRLENQFTTIREIRAASAITHKNLAVATRQSIVAQESLRELPLRQVDTETLQKNIAANFPESPPLTDEDVTTLRGLVNEHRELLRQLNQAASTRANQLAELETAQEALLEEAETLQLLLDENLLWVPSVPAIGLSWPLKVINGAADVFSTKNIVTTGAVLSSSLRTLWPLILIFGICIFTLYRAKPRIWNDVLERSEMVGRVKKDSAWHTPRVVLNGVAMALPLPLTFMLAAIIFNASDNPSPIIGGLAQGFYGLALFTLIFMTWRIWDRDKSLFAAHFKMPRPIRHAVNRNIRWFVPVVGVAMLLSGVSEPLLSENVEEGFAVFIFIFIALSMAFFGYRIIWAKRQHWSDFLTVDNIFVRYRGFISVFLVGTPLAVAVLAGMGYMETADALLERLFMSGILFLLAYVIYGTVKRAIIVAQRKMKYQQAVERRDAALKARQDKAEAEERGEEVSPPPQIDTDEIDVTSITRQSSQLLQVIVLTGLAAFIWMIWSDLMPALSFFDGFEIWQYNTGALNEETGKAIMKAVTVWTLIQAAVIVGLTVLAAKNLPGFLEVFVLNRFGVNPGTRYAIVTILGYLIVGAGIIFAFDRLGLQWSQLKWIATGLSVGIGFGLQKIIANFVSGLIILFERPVRIGDYVTIGEQSGIVSRIQIRATTLSDLDNREILIPNEALISERVTNWTLTNSVTRLIVPVGIAYGSDTDKAREIMLNTLKAIPKVLETPPPQVLFFGFGNSSLDFELRVYLKAFDERVPMRHAIHTEINKALANAGFSIPFPQTDLNIVSQDIPLEIKTMSKPKSKPKPKAAVKPKPKS